MRERVPRLAGRPSFVAAEVIGSRPKCSGPSVPKVLSETSRSIPEKAMISDPIAVQQ